MKQTHTSSSRKGQRRHKMALSHYCSPNLPEASPPLCTLTYSLFVILLSSYSIPTVSNCHQRQPYEYHSRAQQVEQWFCLSGKAASHTYHCVSSYLCSRKKDFFGLKLQHVISSTLFQFLILDLAHQRFKEGHDPLQCDKCRLRSLI